MKELLCSSGSEESKAARRDDIEVARHTEIRESDPHRAGGRRPTSPDPPSSLLDAGAANLRIDHAVLTQSPAESDEAMIGGDHNLSYSGLAEPGDCADELRLDSFEP